MLRKQPNNVLMPSAHAVDREYRVLTALQGSAVPTPKPYRYCADRDVIGTPFYLMEWLDGRVFHEFSTPGLRPDERRELFRSMCAALAAIHPRKFSVGGGERRLKEFGVGLPAPPEPFGTARPHRRQASTIPLPLPTSRAADGSFNLTLSARRLVRLKSGRAMTSDMLIYSTGRAGPICGVRTGLAMP